MCIREILGGEWNLNMAVHGKGVVLMSLVECLRLGYGRIGGWEKSSSHNRFEVGDGSKIRFGHDMWCVDMTLKKAILDLFAIAWAKDASVVAYMELSGGSN